MTRNISFCVIGLFLGFALGFFFANARWTAGPRPPAAVSRNTSATANQAPPLNPQQQNGQLPPGHPSVNETGGNDQSGGASTSPQVQAAMDAADRSPRDFEAQMKAADAFYNTQAYSKAVVYLDRALALKPADPDALTLMGNAKYDLEDFAAAATFYERSLARRPDPDVQTDLGNTYFQRTPPDYDKAIAAYRKTLSIDPKHEKALRNLAAAALFKGDKTTAREMIDRLAAINPTNPALDTLRSGLQQ